MIIADKLYKLRTASGLSQEELAHRLNVSRQSVSKWESGSSIPGLDKIIELSRIYGVSTDYLLMEELEELPGEIVVDTYVKEEYRELSLEETVEYLNLIRSFAKKIALGVMMCILSPVPLILMAGFSESGSIHLTENMAGGIGTAILLIMVAAAVAIFILNGLKLQPYDFLEKESFRLAYGVTGIIEKEEKKFFPVFQKGIVIGVVLCIIAVVPMFLFAAFDASDKVMVCMIAVLLAVISCGVYLLISVGIEKSAYEQLLQRGDYTKEKKAVDRRLETFDGVYWCMVTAVYLAISFIYRNWEISWVVWPVAGILFAGLRAILESVIKDKK